MNCIKYIKAFIVVVILNLFLIPNGYSDFNLTLPNTELEPGVTASINIVVFENDVAFCQNLDESTLNNHSIFAVHGVNSDSSVFQPLVNALFNNCPNDGIVCRVIAIEQPGHGSSGLPVGGPLFGEITEDNYVNVLLNSLEQLSQNNNIQPISIIGHSNGGLVIQLAQQKLVDMGSSLLDNNGFQKITLMASIPSAPVLWPDQQATASFLTNLANCFSGPGNPFPVGCDGFDVEPPGGDGDVDWDDIQDPILDPFGVIWDCDPNTVPVGIPVAPPNCEIASTRGDRLPVGTLGGPAEEPLNIFRQINGVPPQLRPVTDAGIFSGLQNGILQVVAFENDIVVGPTSVHEALFNHLSNTPLIDKFQIVGGPNSSHVMFFTNPEELLDSIAADICLIPTATPTPTPTPPESEGTLVIPTMGQWGMIIITILIGFFAIRMLRNRKDSEI